MKMSMIRVLEKFIVSETHSSHFLNIKQPVKDLVYLEKNQVMLHFCKYCVDSRVLEMEMSCVRWTDLHFLRKHQCLLDGKDQSRFCVKAVMCEARQIEACHNSVLK